MNLVAQRHAVRLAGLEAKTKGIGKIGDEFTRPFHLGRHTGTDAVQGIEKEVRLNLRFKGIALALKGQFTPFMLSLSKFFRTTEELIKVEETKLDKIKEERNINIPDSTRSSQISNAN